MASNKENHFLINVPKKYDTAVMFYNKYYNNLSYKVKLVS